MDRFLAEIASVIRQVHGRSPENGKAEKKKEQEASEVVT